MDISGRQITISVREDNNFSSYSVQKFFKIHKDFLIPSKTKFFSLIFTLNPFDLQIKAFWVFFK